jgi:2-iminoacetate synthase ThiH
MNTLDDVEDNLARDRPLTRADAERVMAHANLVNVGRLGAMSRERRHGRRVTFGRVAEMSPAAPTIERGSAGEVRLVGAPGSAEDARAQISQAARLADGVPCTGYSLTDLVALVNGDHMALVALAAALKDAGLDAVAEAPIDELGSVEDAVEVILAAKRGGLDVFRATIHAAPAAGDRLDLIERTQRIQEQTHAFRAFAPLPRHDSRTQPSTGFDDVLTVTVARLVCRDVPSIQVDWPLYGPKLAQVAIEYGADDLDGIAAIDSETLGRRRSPREDIERQIRAAHCDPVERDGRYAPR